MVEACKIVRLPEPEYGTDGSFVWIRFIRPNALANLDTIKHLSDKQKEVLAFCIIPRSSREILAHIGVTSHSKNRDRFVNYLVDEGYLERTIPDSPNSPQQKICGKKQIKVISKQSLLTKEKCVCTQKSFVNRTKICTFTKEKCVYTQNIL